ncbi:MAG: flagellar basal body rod protein FlgB [Rhizobiales bacterium]|nr:flagellar basal body rod protein FlgB [Hyphomicrobiales bacterium]
MEIFGVASRHIAWLQSRQQVLAENIANSDTPRYRARDITAFDLNSPAFTAQLAATNPLHMQASSAGGASGDFEVVFSRNPDVSHSGNDVSLEREMKKIGESSLAFAFDTSVSKIFHRMTMMSVKG